MKSRSFYVVRYKGLTHSLHAPSPQNACRKAFRHWLKSGLISRQPATTDEGGFEDVEVHGNFVVRPITGVA